MTVSSTCWAMSAARCCADQVAGNSVLRVRFVITAASGSMTSEITVSSGDSHSIAAIETTTSTTVPADSGTIDSSACTSCRSVIAREATCPVRSGSCRTPSMRWTARNTWRRRSCWTSSAIRPPR